MLLTTAKKLVSSYPLIILFVIYLLSHAIFINYNVAEWGDSYRMLRAALFISEGDYPDDEKRPPLFSTLLALRPSAIDPVLFGRIVVLVIGLISFIVFYKLAVYFFKKTYPNTSSPFTYLLTATALFALSPVSFYWSLRIMSDVLFVLLVLVFFAVYYLYTKQGKYIILGLISALAVFTRFEGYLLPGALLLTFSYELLTGTPLKHIVKRGFTYSTCFLLPVIPYLYLNNPFTSSYLDEPAGRAYDLNMLIVFALSLLFVLGITGGAALVTSRLNVFKQHPLVTFFVLLQLLLVCLWPAAVPRLFLPIIPFLAIVASLNTYEYMSKPRVKPLLPIGVLVLTGVFVIGQYLLRLQFLIVNKPVFLAVVTLQLLLVLALYLKKARMFVCLLAASCVLWSVAVVSSHKDLYTTVQDVAKYSVLNLSGDVLSNDTTSIMEWYLNDLAPKDAVFGYYRHLDNDIKIDYNGLVKEKKYEFLVVTNEERPYFEFKPDTRFLTEIYTSTKFTNGAKFYTNIYKINYE